MYQQVNLCLKIKKLILANLICYKNKQPEREKKKKKKKEEGKENKKRIRI